MSLPLRHPDGSVRLYSPMLEGSDRVGVLAFTLPAVAAARRSGGGPPARPGLLVDILDGLPERDLSVLDAH